MDHLEKLSALSCFKARVTAICDSEKDAAIERKDLDGARMALRLAQLIDKESIDGY